MGQPRIPSTDWHETVAPDEDARHRAFAEQIVGIQSRVDRKAGPGRAFHRKQIAGLTARFTVPSDLPAHLRHGLFGRPGAHPAVVRMSNGAMTAQPDVVPDIRGVAFSVRGLTGAGALTATTDRQDFLLINRPMFGFPSSKEFAGIVGPAAQSQTALAKHFVDEYGPVHGPIRLAALAKDLLRPFTGFATATFYSSAPIRFGPYAARLRLRPIGERVNPLAGRDWSADIADRLRDHDLRYVLEAQFFVNEELTPIEDGSHGWSESDSPYETVGRLRIPQQDPGSDSGRQRATEIEADRFDPWAALAEHRPLGEIMRARKAAYFPSVQQRGAARPSPSE